MTTGLGAALVAGPAAPQSTYVRMSDGVRVAVDVYLPRGQAGARTGPGAGAIPRAPALLHQTRYLRAVDLRWPFSMLLRTVYDAQIQRLLDAGYVYVLSDMRGSGASFGRRDRPWSAREVQDGVELADWITRQSWSDGRLGALGWSYDGTAAELLAAERPRGLLAIAPQYAPLDGFDDTGFPNGVHSVALTRFFEAITRAMDRGQLPRFMGFPVRIALRGVSPAGTGAHARAMRDSAIREHTDNEALHRHALTVDYRDDVTADGLSPDSVSPKRRLERTGPVDVAVLAWSGWFDGALAPAALARWQRAAGGSRRLVIGPWTHTGMRTMSPYHVAERDDDAGRVDRVDPLDALVQFFDGTMRGAVDRGDSLPVLYYVLGAERWRRSRAWPVPGVRPDTIPITSAGAAAPPTPTSAITSMHGRDSALTLHSFDAGRFTRWDAMTALDPRRVRLAPPTLPAATSVFTSAPLPADLEITGTPVLSLRLTVAGGPADGVLTAYLHERDASGTRRLVTEGAFRLSNRHVDGAQADEPWVPRHSFRRADAQALVAGNAIDVSFALLPTAYRIARGHVLELSIAGCDTAHFRAPSDVPLRLLMRGDDAHGSRLILPVVPW